MGGVWTWLTAAAVGLAPVPADPAPDPLGWGYLGVQFDSAGDPDGPLRLAGVEPHTPADRAGLQAGDELLKVGDLTPRGRGFQDVVAYVSALRPGTVVRVEVRRGGGRKAVPVRLGARPASLPPPVSSAPLPDLD